MQVEARSNIAVGVQLRHPSGHIFSVVTYHMPCLFKTDNDIKVAHSIIVLIVSTKIQSWDR